MGTTGGSIASGSRKARTEAEPSLEKDNVAFNEESTASSSGSSVDHERKLGSCSDRSCSDHDPDRDSGGQRLQMNHAMVEQQKSSSVYFSQLAKKAEALQKQYDANLLAGTAKLKEIIGSHCELVKLTHIEGRLVVVVDGAVCPDERDHIFASLETSTFRRTEFARPETKEFRHLVAEHRIEDIAETTLFFVVKTLVRIFFVDPEQEYFDHQPYRVYTNAVTFGDVAFVHQDSCSNNQVTALFYSNRQWASHLGGETMFYNEKREVVEAVEPRPGRLCLFHGIIPHKGSPPGRLFQGCRYTTAFKFFTSKEDGKVEQETEA